MNPPALMTGVISALSKNGGAVQFNESVTAAFFLRDGRMVALSKTAIFTSKPTTRIPVVGDRIVCSRKEAAVLKWGFADHYEQVRGEKPPGFYRRPWRNGW